MKTLLTLILIMLTLVAPAGAAQAQRALSYRDFLGKTMDDDAVVQFILKNNCAYGMGNYACKSQGIELGVTMVKRRIRTVFMFRQGVEGYKQYKGELPFGLKWTDSAAAVEARLGRPTQRFSNSDGSVTYSYRTRNLWLDFDGSAPSAKMRRVQIQAPQ